MGSNPKGEPKPAGAPVQPESGRRWAAGVLLPLWLGFTALSLLPGLSFGQAIKEGEVLTLSRAVEIALATQPAILAARYSVKASEARVGEALSNYYPQVTGSASYLRIKQAPATVANTTVPAGGLGGSPGAAAVANSSLSPFNVGSYDLYTGSLNLSQVVYDFGKTSSQVKVNKLNSEASRFDLLNARATVVLNVKQGYYNVLQAQRNRDVAKESADQFQRHLEQARGFFEAGTKSRFDVTKAEVDLANAQVSLISAEDQVKLAIVALNNAMGFADAPGYKLEDVLLYTKFDLSFEDALAAAYAQRPDLLAQEKRTRASKESITLARKGYFPVLTANGAYEYTGFDFPLSAAWTYGLNLSIPVFNGQLTYYQELEARANFGTASANERSLRLDIYSQVQQGYVNLWDASERITASEASLRQAKENVDLANGRYDAGVGSPLEVTDAILAQANAESTYTAALRDYKTAQAVIEKAIGAK
jgi:outer membrane protein